MNRTEYKIDAKIIKQISLYLMLHGVHDFNLTFLSNKKDVTFILKSQTLSQKVLDTMQEKLSRQRELEVEVYGWELMGDTDTQNELDILGSLIDEVEITKDNEVTTVTMRRTYRYNK